MILVCAFTLWLGTAGETSAGVVHADLIRAAIVDTLTAVAERNGLEIQVSLPYVSNVVIKRIETPLIRVNAPSRKAFHSRMQVKVDFMNNEEETIRQVTVVAQVKSFTMVAVTAVDVNRGDGIEQDDVVMKKMNVAKYKDYFVSPFELEGMQAKRRLKAGTILTGKNVEPVPVIRRGDRVIMKACIGNIVITAEGTARENGGLNECIRVYNEATRKTIICRVLNSRTVQIAGIGG